MLITQDGERIRLADHAAGIIEGTAKSEYVGLTRPISVRLPVHLAVQLDALAQQSQKTRNATFTTLLEVGLEEVRERLSDETVSELTHIEQAMFHDFSASMRGSR